MPDGSCCFRPARPGRARAAAPSPTRRCASRPPRARPSTTAGARLAELAELPPLPTTLTARRRRKSAPWPGTTARTSASTARSTPIAAASTAASTATPGPSHAYLGYSPGLDFETKLLFKPDLPALLEKELRKPGYVAEAGGARRQHRPLPAGRAHACGSPAQVLEVLERFGHPVTIVTKSAGVLRDLDILARLARRNLVHVCLSVTTLDAGAGAADGAARGRAGAAAGGDPGAGRGRRPGRRAGGADDPRR